MDIERQAGLLLLAGFEQDRLVPELKELLGEVQPAGVVFFRRNIAGAEPFAELVRELSEYLAGMLPRGSHPVLAIDQEGGAVDRLRDALAPLPSPHAVFSAHDDLFARNFGALVGQVLASFRLNVNFAPVLDLATPQSEQVMAGRVVSSDARQVLRFARNFLAGQNRFGIFGCAKHFPGLGSAPLDTHLEMATVDKTAEQLWDEDVLPFRDLHDDLLLMMVNHAWYPALHPPGTAPRPASLSPHIVTGLLRERMGFKGVVVADDMEMGGVLAGRSIGEAAVAAVEAGCDLLPVCRVAENVRGAHRALVERARNDAAFTQRVEDAARRIEVLQQALARSAEHPPQPDWKRLAGEIREMRAAAEHMAELVAAAPRFSNAVARPERRPRPGGGGGGGGRQREGGRSDRGRSDRGRGERGERDRGERGRGERGRRPPRGDEHGEKRDEGRRGGPRQPHRGRSQE